MNLDDMDYKSLIGPKLIVGLIVFITISTIQILKLFNGDQYLQNLRVLVIILMNCIFGIFFIFCIKFLSFDYIYYLYVIISFNLLIILFFKKFKHKYTSFDLFFQKCFLEFFLNKSSF